MKWLLNFSYTRHLMIPDLLVMNTATLKGMSEEDQQTLKDLLQGIHRA